MSEDARGQAEVLGFSLLIGLTIIGTVAIVVIGSTALIDMQSGSEIDRAEHTMTQLDSKISLVGLGSSESHESIISQDRGGSQVYVDDSKGWMNVSIKNDGALELEVMNETLGAIIYEAESGETTIAYQGGGVWKKDKSGSAMISPPEFHYRIRSSDSPTLTLPLVTIHGNQPVNEKISIQEGQTIAQYPNATDPDRTNPLENGTVEITVKSEYYQAWGHFFESRTGGSVEYDNGNETVIIELVIPKPERLINTGMDATATDKALSFAGGGGTDSPIDSYNSSKGPYSESRSWNATLQAAGDVELSGTITVHGDVVSGESILIDGNSVRINGTGYSVEGIQSNPNWEPDEGEEEIDNVESTRSISSEISAKIEEVDHEGPDLNTENELESDEYYYDSIHLSDNDLTFDTSGGNIILAVDGEFTAENADLSVEGDGDVHLYVDGDVTFNNVKITANNDSGRKFWVYGPGTTQIDVESSNLTGVIYAPAGEDDGGEIILTDSDIYGALIGNIEGDQKSTVHQDLALKDYTPFPEDPEVAHLTYLHVSVNPVTVTVD